jgi:hypothetical protein
LLLHGFGNEPSSIVTTPGLEENKSVHRNRVLLLCEFGGGICSIVTRSVEIIKSVLGNRVLLIHMFGN